MVEFILTIIVFIFAILFVIKQDAVKTTIIYFLIVGFLSLYMIRNGYEFLAVVQLVVGLFTSICFFVFGHIFYDYKLYQDDYKIKIKTIILGMISTMVFVGAMFILFEYNREVLTNTTSIEKKADIFMFLNRKNFLPFIAAMFSILGTLILTVFLRNDAEESSDKR